MGITTNENRSPLIAVLAMITSRPTIQYKWVVLNPVGYGNLPAHIIDLQTGLFPDLIPQESPGFTYSLLQHFLISLERLNFQLHFKFVSASL